MNKYGILPGRTINFLPFHQLFKDITSQKIQIIWTAGGILLLMTSFGLGAVAL